MGFRGTSVEQDSRWGKADEKLLKKMAHAGKFSAVLNKKVDMSKVDLDVIGKWCKERLQEILQEHFWEVASCSMHAFIFVGLLHHDSDAGLPRRVY